MLEPKWLRIYIYIYIYYTYIYIYIYIRYTIDPPIRDRSEDPLDKQMCLMLDISPNSLSCRGSGGTGKSAGERSHADVIFVICSR